MMHHILLLTKLSCLFILIWNLLARYTSWLILLIVIKVPVVEVSDILNIVSLEILLEKVLLENLLVIRLGEEGGGGVGRAERRREGEKGEEAERHGDGLSW